MRGGFRQFVFQKSVFLKHPNVDQFFAFIKWENKPKFDNLSRNFSQIADRKGRGGVVKCFFSFFISSLFPMEL